MTQNSVRKASLRYVAIQFAAGLLIFGVVGAMLFPAYIAEVEPDPDKLGMPYLKARLERAGIVAKPTEFLYLQADWGGTIFRGKMDTKGWGFRSVQSGTSTRRVIESAPGWGPQNSGGFVCIVELSKDESVIGFVVPCRDESLRDLLRMVVDREAKEVTEREPTP